MTHATFRPLLLALATAFLVAGCGDDGISPTARELEVAAARWEAQGLTRYTVEARVLCFCSPELADWHELEVVRDSVVAARRLDPRNGASAPAGWFRSIEATFAFARRWPREQRGNRIEADFDPQTGLPVRVTFLAPPTVADGDAVYAFRALKPGLTVGARAAR